jgi:hypothetical protein
MDEEDPIFPMDVPASSSRSWKFRSEGYLVVILADGEEAQRAEAALVEGGFAARDVKRYTGEQILENYEVYKEQPTLTDKVVGTLADDVESRELYLEYAREDRSAMWVRIPDEDDVPKALRVLADFEYLHTRYYGVEKQADVHIS